MVKEITIQLSPEKADNEEQQLKAIYRKLRISPDEIKGFRLIRRSIDARSRNIKIHLRFLVYLQETPPSFAINKREYQDISLAEPVIVIGAGPAGLFAGLRLIELGKKPIILERGKDVISRRKDLGILHREHIVDPDSNYCFGEGGAGTYSDGKLYTRSKKRGSLKRVLDILIEHGASEDIGIDAHPHIGTNKLPKIIAKMRESILNAGGEIHFNTRVTDFILKEDKITAVKTLQGDTIDAKHVILATGHSARDIFELLDRKNILIEAKEFALGIRIEHPQPIIDKIQYHCDDRGRHLPAASYSLVHQVNDRGVYSFCMCPGGHIVPAATANGEIVVNGMSASTRSSRYANSGMVVAITMEDLKKYEKEGPLAAMRFQQDVERNCWVAGGKTQKAPAQRMVDFTQKKVSNDLNVCSYIPGLESAPLHEVLPQNVSRRLQDAFPIFGRKMKGYFTNEANLLAVESRTSSPVKVPRDSEKLHHPQITNLYPCGEGPGYAGGIVSAAIDGERCAEAIVGFKSI